ncbi:hypothetical protein [Burkholderia metallica]|uniref:hypothetical protein n=1 Tax=Burkholderia metallica TaxID=488729 RepID=UPI0012F4A74F|nr:hypothetical protein [Burkholderia metallica]
MGRLNCRFNFLFVENDLILVLSSCNGGGVGQGFVIFRVGLAKANTGKGEPGSGGSFLEISLIFNCFRKMEKDC